MMYVLPSRRSLPAALTACSEPSSLRSVKLQIDAAMKPRSKSVWMVPAASGAVEPFLMVQARHSFLPAVRND